MKKGLKSAGIVALSAVLACGALGVFAGCGGGGAKPTGDKNTLTVSIYCGDSDAATNQKICDDWAASYNQKNGTNIRVKFNSNPDKTNYYDTLNPEWSAGNTADIIYLAPKYLKSYVEKGNVLDLTEYLSDDDFAALDDVWENGINYYSYIKDQKTTYSMGQPVKKSADGKSFVTASTNEKVGLYGLPKDYSNFSTGYNRKFFSDDLKTAYTTTKPNNGKSVKSPTGEGTKELTSKIKNDVGKAGYDHDEEDDKCIVYAGDSSQTYTAYNPYTKKTYEVKGGQSANIINVGVPTTYYPYNFFRYANYQQALSQGDPVAVMSDKLGGYTVTLPGFPNDELKITETAFNSVYTDGNFGGITDVPYDKTMGHVTYTYAEYGALLWACTYYLNTFAWDEGANNYGGITSGDKHYTVYGGEQYEGIAGATGSVLYLLPWLAANDADLINDVSALTSQAGRTDGKGVDLSKFTDPTKWKDAAGTATYTTKKKTLAETEVEKQIQYGHDSQNFIETYAAFLAIGSDWNVNPCGDTEDPNHGDKNGWEYFRTGRSLCYGAGSWDASTRNDYNQSVLDFGQMPTPIAEKYALYSVVKDANYQRAIYSNDPAGTTATTEGYANEGKQRSDLSAGLKVYDEEEILKNQIRRQDKWAARMDTVGYAVAAKVKDYKGDHAWKAEAAASLVAQLTINRETQVELLYAGAQLPNFKSQCKEFVSYKTYGEEGAFKDMLTPEGFADTETKEEGAKIWQEYYKVAMAMETAAQSHSTQTVAEFLNGKKITIDGKTTDVKYDPSYASTKLNDFTGVGNARLAFSMKVLRMTTFRADDRDINIRMQYGLNGVRDSSMYTYENNWMSSIDARNDTRRMLAYTVKNPLGKSTDGIVLNFLKPGSTSGTFTSEYIQMLPTQTGSSYYTPAIWCFTKAPLAQELLSRSMTNELNEIMKK